jgi:hypothetical protein
MAAAAAAIEIDRCIADPSVVCAPAGAADMELHRMYATAVRFGTRHHADVNLLFDQLPVQVVLDDSIFVLVMFYGLR